MITLDTHAIIWSALQPDRLSEKATRAIDQANKFGEILIADISLWEIAMLIQKKRIIIEVSYTDFIDLICLANSYRIVPISAAIAGLSVAFGKDMNLDPADRLICATSIVHGAPLVTADENLRSIQLLNSVW